jgi:Cache 3/Cache 2 fusion domain
MSRSLLACLLSLACFVMLTPSVAFAQMDQVKSSMENLKSETGKLGSPRVEGNDLYFGTTKVSDSLVDDLVAKQLRGADITLLVKSGDQYVRVATTIDKEKNTSAVGTTLDANSPAVAMLNNGEGYYGEAMIFGNNYDAGYEPIKDESGAVIGAYFVGFSK